MLYPLLWMFASSFKGPSEIWTNVMSLVPRASAPRTTSPGGRASAASLSRTFYKNSLIYAGVGTVLGGHVARALAAYGFARIRFAGRGVLVHADAAAR